MDKLIPRRPRRCLREAESEAKRTAMGLPALRGHQAERRRFWVGGQNTHPGNRLRWNLEPLAEPEWEGGIRDGDTLSIGDSEIEGLGLHVPLPLFGCMEGGAREDGEPEKRKNIVYSDLPSIFAYDQQGSVLEQAGVGDY